MPDVVVVTLVISVLVVGSLVVKFTNGGTS